MAPVDHGSQPQHLQQLKHDIKLQGLRIDFKIGGGDKKDREGGRAQHVEMAAIGGHAEGGVDDANNHTLSSIGIVTGMEKRMSLVTTINTRPCASR